MNMPNDQGGRKRRILILDDEPIVCKRLKPAFLKAGYEAETFTDSASALDAFRDAGFDIVITDLKMDGMDGMQFLAAIKELNPAVECIVITGYATMESAKESFKIGAYDFVAKPFKLRDIMDAVKRLERERLDNTEA